MVKNLIIIFLCYFVLLMQSTKAELFSELIHELLENDESVRAARLAVDSSKYAIDIARSSIMPDFSLTVPYGYEHQVKNDAENSHMAFHEFKVKLSQTVLDFGSSSASIKQAKTGSTIAVLSLRSSVNNKIFEALSAYINLIKSVENLGYSKKSEDRIIEVTRLEDARVQRGGGLATNVLQAKAQLAGARAARVNSEGALVSAINRYKNVFKKEPGDFSSFERPPIPIKLIPEKVEDAIRIARQNNVDLAISGLSVRNARYGLESSETSFLPSIKASAELNNKRDSASVVGTKIEHIYKLELSYPISLGGPNGVFYKERAAYRTALNSYTSAKYNYDQLNRTIEELVRNSWQGMKTSKANAEFLRNQANISGEFFDLAMKEVQLGNRQLINVLSAETSYIGAISAAINAQTDYQLAAYQLLMSMGYLTREMMTDTKRCMETPFSCIENPPENPMRLTKKVSINTKINKKGLPDQIESLKIESFEIPKYSQVNNIPSSDRKPNISRIPKNKLLQFTSLNASPLPPSKPLIFKDSSINKINFDLNQKKSSNSSNGNKYHKTIDPKDFNIESILEGVTENKNSKIPESIENQKGMPIDIINSLRIDTKNMDSTYLDNNKSRSDIIVSEERVAGSSVFDEKASNVDSQSYEIGPKIQLAAMSTQTGAIKSWNKLLKKHKSLFSELKYNMVKANIKGKGTVYRLQTQVLPSIAFAKQLCKKLKAKETPCLVIKN